MSKRITTDSFKKTILEFNSDEYNSIMDDVLLNAQKGILDIFITVVGIRVKYDNLYVSDLSNKYKIPIETSIPFQYN